MGTYKTVIRSGDFELDLANGLTHDTADEAITYAARLLATYTDADMQPEVYVVNTSTGYKHFICNRDARTETVTLADHVCDWRGIASDLDWRDDDAAQSAATKIRTACEGMESDDVIEVTLTPSERNAQIGVGGSPAVVPAYRTEDTSDIAELRNYINRSWGHAREHAESQLARALATA